MGGIGSSCRLRVARFLSGDFCPDRWGAGEAFTFASALRGLVGFFDILLALSLELS